MPAPRPRPTEPYLPAVLRTILAVGASCAAWWLFAWLPETFDLGPWYFFVVILTFAVGPALVAAAVCLPHIRGTEMTVPGVAAAIAGPVFLWMFLIPTRSDDGTPTKLLSLIIFIPLAALGALLAWGVAVMVQAVQETRDEQSGRHH